ncbi:MAG: ferrous iron transport protein B [Oscillospiraceae bacterium]|nr:ferrous iron transport protein B [Oscillospiraceae bacterium]
MNIALVGNQNSGKTTLFNQLTGSNQHVGNFPGVTVERKEGTVRYKKEMNVVDLPGIYSLAPYSSEEKVARDFIVKNKPDGIINIVDASNIERNLYLSMQLIEIHVPMVIALNMMDEVRESGGTIKIEELSCCLGVPVVPISASKNEGIAELIEVAYKTFRDRVYPQQTDYCAGEVHRTIHSIAHLIEDHAERVGVPAKFIATKLVEGDISLRDELELNSNEIDMIDHAVKEMEDELKTDRKSAIADMRYSYIEKVVAGSVVRPGVDRSRERTLRIDRLLTNKYLAIPIFLSIMGLIFWLTFSVIGSYLSDILGEGIDGLSELVRRSMESVAVNPTVISLVTDGVFSGVGSVLTFIPTIILLFFFLSMLEDSGYMSRVAFVMDTLLRKIGLSGRSFVPMLIGFGCSVPAIMSTRTLPSERDRKMTIFLVPFMSCTAKLPIYGMFTLAFFPKQAALVMISLYVLGMVLAVLTGLLMKNLIFRGKPVPFVMELPNYRLPGIKSVLMLLWDKTKDFLTKAFTLIFIASLVIWVLRSFDATLNLVADDSDSLLAGIGRLITPVFEPLGFGNWKAVTALLTGFMAKEAVISTFAVLTGAGSANLPEALNVLFTPVSAYAFLVFTLLYTPCVAAIATMRKELKSRLLAVAAVLYQTGFAWIMAFLFYQVGTIIFG